MEAETPNVPEETSELSALQQRVAELERVVAELQRQRGPEPILIRPRHQAVPPPPPGALPGLPMLRPAVAPAAAAKLPPPKSLEDRLGSQVFNMVGIFALIFGTAYFLKLAIDHGWIGPLARVVIGLVAGAGLVLWSEVFRRKTMLAFSYSLKAIGSAVLYLSLWAAFHLWHLLPAPVALGAMVLVTAWNAWMALRQDAELLAGYALAGGLLTPLLVSSGGDHETFLFSYTGALALGVVVLLRTKPWRWLIVPAFLGVVGYFIGWYSRFFRYGSGDVWSGVSTETALFVVVFFAIFALPTIKGWVTQEEPAKGRVLLPVLLPLANAAWLALGLYSVFEDSGLHADLAFLMVGCAAVLLGLMQVQRSRISAAMQLAAAVVCLTVAVPLKASGHTLTTAWLVEGLILYWASTRFEDEEGSPAIVLWLLSLGGYGLGLASLFAHWWWFGADNAGFFNRNLGAALVAVGVLAGAAVLGSRKGSEKTAEAVVWAALTAIDLVAVLLAVRELGSGWTGEAHPAFANAEFATAVVGLVVLAGVAWTGYRVSLAVERRRSLEVLAAVTTVLFHLVTILSVEREIGALWTRSEADLQRSLAISGFLMLYGVGLLTFGFVRRSGFVRWQALLLLIFTICKVFLYDIGGLSAGYRVASFMGLGAVLMAVSYAYQKDWLGLKASHVAPPPPPPPPPHEAEVQP